MTANRSGVSRPAAPNPEVATIADTGTSPSNRVRVGIVVIGRNEGDRLAACLLSLVAEGQPVVYVDSGSTDGSPARAASIGATVHALDMRRPFTAARARNEGFRRLLALVPAVERVQFVDGDCEVAPGWLAEASGFLDHHPTVVAVCGRRRERFPERSIYNQLCDIEWDTPVGEALACGGDVLMRVRALAAVSGYRDDLIAGEEPELCVRLRAKGGLIWRLDAEMTLHDAAMLRFGQWWRRCVRTGFAFAEGARLHGAPPERHWVREYRSVCLWGGALPAAIVATAVFGSPLALLGLIIYPLQVLRLAGRSAEPAGRVRWLRPLFLVLGKFPEFLGVLRAWRSRFGRPSVRLIEYK